jgi:hypothetical protein
MCLAGQISVNKANYWRKIAPRGPYAASGPYGAPSCPSTSVAEKKPFSVFFHSGLHQTRLNNKLGKNVHYYMVARFDGKISDPIFHRLQINKINNNKKSAKAIG